MKKILFMAIGLAFIVSIASANLVQHRRTSGAASGTDFTADSNCMGAWYMNNNGGSETDRSGEGLTLTAVSTPGTSSTVPSGYSGSSRLFDDTDPDVLYSAESNGNGVDISGADQDISICIWFRVDQAISADMNMVSKYNTTGNNRQYMVKIDDSDGDKLKFWLSGDGTTPTAAIGATTLTNDSTFHHACFVYNDTDMRIYLDGSLDSNGSDNPKTYSSGIYNGTADFVVGGLNSTGSAYPFSGYLDEPNVLDRELSSSEVADIYADGVDGDSGGND